MSNFWIGFSLALAVSVGQSLHTLLTLEKWPVILRQKLNWTPVAITIAFLSGYLFDLQNNPNNEILGGFLVGGVLVCNFILYYLLEHNSSFLEKIRVKKDWQYLRISMCVVLVASLFLSLVPYQYYYKITKVSRWIWLFPLIITVLYWKILPMIKGAIESDIKKKIFDMFRVCNTFSIFSGTNEKLMNKDRDRELWNYWKDATKADLKTMAREVNKLQEMAQKFDPLRGDRGSSLNVYFLPKKDVKELVQNEQKRILENIMIRDAMLKSLIGSEADRQDGIDIIRQYRDDEFANEIEAHVTGN